MGGEDNVKKKCSECLWIIQGFLASYTARESINREVHENRESEGSPVNHTS